MLLQMLRKKIIDWMKKILKPKRKPIAAEDFIYNVDRVSILYSIVQNNFHYCMKNGILKRKDILEFKFMVNKFVYQNEFRHEKFQNDAHEIYRKLKSHSISKKNMLRLNEFLQLFIVAAVQPLQEKTIPVKYGNLVVVK
jgi:hypothetical protein